MGRADDPDDRRDGYDVVRLTSASDADADAIAAVLARYRGAVTPEPGQTRDAWQRMRVRIDAGEAPMHLDDDAPAEGRRGWLVWAGVAFAAAAMIALALSLDIGGVLQARLDGGSADNEAPYIGEQESADGFASEAERKAASRKRPSAAGDPPAGPAVEPEGSEPAPVPVDDPTPQVEPDPIAPTPAPRKPKRPRPKSGNDPAPADATIAAELALLREAQRAIAGGNPARGLEKIQQHAKTFPRSMMTEERELARVRALCALGRAGRARKAAERFRRKFGKSHLVPQLEKTCAGSPP